MKCDKWIKGNCGRCKSCLQNSFVATLKKLRQDCERCDEPVMEADDYCGECDWCNLRNKIDKTINQYARERTGPSG